MKRAIEQELLAWKDKKDRSPLIIRGARQVGKSYTVEVFGKENFEELLIVNFEENPRAKSCFDSLDVETILKQLGYLYGVVITPLKTLLFLDEIQLCPQAIRALRYFKEKLPLLHVIAAGSLLEFVLENENTPLSFPVGRVRFLNMKPLTFREFMQAIGQGQWEQLLQETDFHKTIPEEFHRHLLEFVREYFLIGGMPAAIRTYLNTRSYVEVQREHRALLDIYRLDLAKYGQKKEFSHLQKLFDQAPFFVAKHFRYSKIDPESTNPAREYKNALRKLQQAGLILPVYATSANGLPLKAEVNEKKFKLLFLDIGLLQTALGIDPSIFGNSTFHQVNSGALAEQFVGQEWLSYADCYSEPSLFFWETEKKGNSAEIDFLSHLFGTMLPIEVKAGQKGSLRSLAQFLEVKKQPLGLHISSAPLSLRNKILSIPFYLIKEVPRILELKKSL